MIKKLLRHWRPIRVSSVLRTEDGRRVQAMVDGTPLWFESDDLRLHPSMDAFLLACALPAALQGRSIWTDAPVAPDLLDAIGKAGRITRSWWKHAPLRIQSPKPSGTGSPMRTTSETECPPDAMGCSCGVDALHALVSARPSTIFFVHGFDIPLGQRNIADCIGQTLREAARFTGTRAAILRTNLREHPVIRGTDWELCYGAALVATGHLIVRPGGRLIIASSHSPDMLTTTGSHPELDPLWSTHHMRVDHVGADKDRIGKIEALRHHPGLLDLLRVCWENPSVSGNCGHCEKCLRTRIALWLGAPDSRCVAFPSLDRLADDIAALNPTALRSAQREILHGMLQAMPQDHPVASTLRTLLERCPKPEELRHTHSNG